MSDSAKLLMSPLDFTRVAGPEQAHKMSKGAATPTKRMLFEKRNKDGKFSANWDCVEIYLLKISQILFFVPYAYLTL